VCIRRGDRFVGYLFGIDREGAWREYEEMEDVQLGANFLRTVVGDGLKFVGDRYNVLRIYALLNTTGQPHSMPVSICDSDSDNS
jgi:hypothetical protein